MWHTVVLYIPICIHTYINIYTIYIYSLPPQSLKGKNEERRSILGKLQLDLLSRWQYRQLTPESDPLKN